MDQTINRSASEGPDLTGTWEIKGRNPILGATLLLLLVGSIYFAVQVIAQIAVFGIGALVGDAPTSGILRDTYQPLLLAIVAGTQYVILLGGGLWGVRRWHTPDVAAYLRLDHFSAPGALLGTVGALAIVPPAQYIAQYLSDLVPGLRKLAESTSFLIAADSPGELVAIVAALAFTPAVCEEFFFRAYFQRTLERGVRGVWSVVIAGALFALFHQQVLTLPSLLLVGVYLSYLYYAFGSPYPVAIAHFLYNAVQLVLANVAVDAGWIDPETGFSLPAAVAGLVVLGVVLGTAERLRRSRRSATTAPERFPEDR
ncbi:MAG: CPBP family intramembrane glutamic endopeptidase [Spirochaetota bacterium]